MPPGVEREMSMSNKYDGHTPGPWRWLNHIHDSRVGNERFEQRISDEPSMKYLIGADGQGFAHTVGLREPRDRANAYLLAAAPALKAACEAIQREAEPRNDIGLGTIAISAQTITKVLAALALANGGGA